MSRTSIETSLKVLFIDHPDQRSPTISYLKEGASSFDEPQLAKLDSRAFKYTLIDDILYKNSFTIPYLYYLWKDEADYTLREIHKGIYEQHPEEQALAHKAFKQGFYWPTMRRDMI